MGEKSVRGLPKALVSLSPLEDRIAEWVMQLLGTLSSELKRMVVVLYLESIEDTIETEAQLYEAEEEVLRVIQGLVTAGVVVENTEELLALAGPLQRIDAGSGLTAPPSEP